MEWRTCAMVSTAHISRATALLLAHTADYVDYDPVDPLGDDTVRPYSQGDTEKSLPLGVNAIPCGWQVYCNTEDPEIWADERKELTERAPDLLAVIDRVQFLDRDCMWIWFDCDAEPDDKLPTFNWEEEKS